MYGECKTTCLLTSLTCSLQCQMIMSTGKYQPPLWVKQRTQCPWCSQSNVKGVFHFSRRLTQQPIYRTLQIWLKLLLESDFWPVPQLVLEHGVFADPLGLSIQSFCKIVPATALYQHPSDSILQPVPAPACPSATGPSTWTSSDRKHRLLTGRRVGLTRALCTPAPCQQNQPLNLQRLVYFLHPSMHSFICDPQQYQLFVRQQQQFAFLSALFL